VPPGRSARTDSCYLGCVGSPSQRLELHLPTATILKVIVTALLVWALLTVWPQLVYLFVALLLALALEPFVAWLVQRGLSRPLAVGIIALVLLALCVGVVGFVLPPLAAQTVDLFSDLSVLRHRVAMRMPADQELTRKVVDQLFRLPDSPEISEQMDRPLLWGQLAASGLLTLIFVMITTLYLLLDGKRFYAWLLAYVPRRHREKMALTVPEVSQVVCAYVRGQLITSALFSVFVGITLWWLDVPAVLPLALLAGICDVIPFVGIILATLPAAILALTVSPSVALVVVALYTVYHLVETYFIVPRVYGNTLRLSTLAVLLALVIGGTLQGILGAVLILPVVAAYPIVERIWLKDYLAREVIDDHAALAAAPASSDAAVDAVLQGEEHEAIEGDAKSSAAESRARPSPTA
jgi:predicted PurR-regulated permease PerM